MTMTMTMTSKKRKQQTTWKNDIYQPSTTDRQLGPDRAKLLEMVLQL